MRSTTRGRQLPRYWATSKVDPKNLILACSRKEGLLYHEEVLSSEGDQNDTTDNEEDTEEEEEDYTDEDDEDESSRPKPSEPRGRFKGFDAHQTICVDTDTATGSEDDTLVGVEGLHTPKKTAKYGSSGQNPAIRLKHV